MGIARQRCRSQFGVVWSLRVVTIAALLSIAASPTSLLGEEAFPLAASVPAFATAAAADLPGPPSGRGYTNCVPNSVPLVFDGGYEVRMCYETASGVTGEGKGGIWASGESGLLWFFTRDNAEVLIKVLDGCQVNGYRWVAVAPVTDLAYNLYVTSPSGAHWRHHNRQGVRASTGGSVTAFPCPPRPRPCTRGWVCLNVSPGEVHRSTRSRPNTEFGIRTPAGTYTRARFLVRIRHGGWRPGVTHFRHQLFWFARERHQTGLFGFAMATGRGGPTKPHVVFRSGFNQEHGNKGKYAEDLLLRPGETYEALYDFDAANDRTLLTLTDSSGRQVLRVEGRTHLLHPITKARQREFVFSARNGPGGVRRRSMRVGFGFLGAPGEARTPPGWVWSNLHVELLPK